MCAMQIDLSCPSLLTLGAARLSSERGAIACALQFPTISALARPAQALTISGACADVALRHALARLPGRSGEVEIDLAIPLHMGLGGDAMLGESVVALLAKINAEPELAPHSLAAHAFSSGGLIFVTADGRLLRHSTILHNDAQAWVFVLALPNPPDDTAADLESDRADQLFAAQTLCDAAPLFDAADADDFDGFARALALLHAAQAPLPAADAALASFFNVMHERHAAFAGQMPTGLGAYGLIQGGPASRDLRDALQRGQGYYGPMLMGSICADSGAFARRS
jgi:predicted sugar kinase